MRKIVLPRRIFLRGACGITLGLPLLESLGTRPAIAQEDGAFRYAILLRQGNGIVQESFWPSQAGRLTKASLEADAQTGDKSVSVLADYADKLNLVHGLGYQHSGSGCGHADGCFQALTASTKNGNNANETLAMGPSLDWAISQALDPDGVEPLSLYAGATSSFLGDVILYRGAMERRAGERDPKNAYQRLFGSMGGGEEDPTQAALERLAAQRKSVNDVVRNEMKILLARPELSNGDRTRLDAHFSAIRDLETQVISGCQVTPLANENPEGVDESVRIHLDLIALAMACGKTHVATLCIGNGNDQTQYTIDGKIVERYHHISHRVHSDGADGEPIPDAELLHHKIDKKFAGYFKYLLDKLSAIQTPQGTLLDDGVSAWFNDLASGPPHGSKPVPWVLAGGAAGALQTGQYIRGDFTINKMLNTIGAAVGMKNAQGEPLDDFGDAGYEKGHIDGMLA